MCYRMLSKYRSELMGAAMLWVMLFHASDLDLGHPLLNSIRAAGFGGVDIFILLSSMGLAMSLARREQDYSAFMARRAARILPAYYLVMLPYTLFLILAQGKHWSALLWNSTLLYYWMRSSGAFNWYVAGAMTFYAVTPMCFRRLRRSRHREGLTALAVVGGLLVCQLLTHEGYWYVTDFFYRVPVFFLGLLAGFWVLEDRKLTGRSLAFWGTALALGACYAAVSLTAPWIGWPVHFPPCHLFLFTTVPMCLILALCLDRLPLGWLSRFLALVGKNSLEIYLLNVTLFSLPELLPAPPSSGPGNWLYYLISFALNIAMGRLLHDLVEGLRRRWRTRPGRPGPPESARL